MQTKGKHSFFSFKKYVFGIFISSPWPDVLGRFKYACCSLFHGKYMVISCNDGDVIKQPK